MTVSLPAIVTQRTLVDLDSAAQSIRRLLDHAERHAVADALEIGREALRVSRALAHGEFLPWCRQMFGNRSHTVRRCKALAEFEESNPGKLATLANLGVTACYAISTAPKTALDQILAEQEPSTKQVNRILRVERKKLKLERVRRKKKRTKSDQYLLTEAAAMERAEADEERRAALINEAAAITRAALGDELEHVITLLREADKPDSYFAHRLSAWIEALARA